MIRIQKPEMSRAHTSARVTGVETESLVKGCHGMVGGVIWGRPKNSREILLFAIYWELIQL